MMKIVLSAALWILCVFALNRPWSVGDTTLPPLGRFLSPGGGFWQNAEPVSGKTKPRTIHLSGVRQEIQILFDDRMVPHIFAQSDEDACYAQGYITAMHRLWQMDFTTRAAAGEMSKVFGPRALEFDRGQRRIGMGFAAENAVKGFEAFPDDMAMLQAYAEGVNAYIASLSPHEYPLEYKLLNYAPEPWSPLRTAYFAKSMAKVLCFKEFDLEHSNLLQWLGQERFDALFPERNPNVDPIIPFGTQWKFEPVNVQMETKEPSAPPPSLGGFSQVEEPYHIGSNNWAVAGRHTQSGAAILCNDPHLALSMPSVWYELQIVTPSHNVYGASLPGVPGVIIGFNKHFTWGLTNVEHDVLDWYTIQWTDDRQTTYLLDGKAVPAQLRIEKIEVRGRETVYDTIRYTHWGPVQNDGMYKGLAMRWLAHDIPDTRDATTFLRINRATSYPEFSLAIEGYFAPAQNFVYADRQGNISMQIGGRLPLRHHRNGRFVQDGSLSANGWQDRIPATHNPNVLNPARGFVSSTNQPSTDTTYPYIYHGSFDAFRSRNLNRYLAGVQSATPQSMMDIQRSNRSLKAEMILPHLLDAIAPSVASDDRALYEQLQNWQMDYEGSATAPVLFEIWYKVFHELLWDDFYAIKDSLTIYTPASWYTVHLVQTDPESTEFDIDSTAVIETFEDIARLSFSQAAQEFRDLPESQKAWGQYRETTIRHLANLGPFHRIVHVSGHRDALNATSTTNGPSWRMVVHLTDPVEAYVIYPGGQSGNPGSSYYATMIDRWTRGEYYLAKYAKTPEDLESYLDITLTPAGR